MVDWSYIAGFFDGEGSIHFTTDARAVMYFSNMHRETLERIRQFIMDFLKVDYITLRSWKKNPKYKMNADYYAIQIANHEHVLKVAEKLVEYSITKHDKLLRAIVLIKCRKWQKWNCGALKDVTGDDLARLYSQMGTVRMARLYGVSQNSIIRKMQRLNIKLRSVKEAQSFRRSLAAQRQQ